MHPEHGDVSAYPPLAFATTTTHDTETLMGYLELLSHGQKKQLAQYANVPYIEEDKIFAQRLRKSLIDSPAQGTLIPLQDWLLTRDRINIPGTEKEVGDLNWRYKTQPVSYTHLTLPTMCVV